MKSHTDPLSKASDIGTHISGALHEAMRENSHDLHRVSERLADSINDLANKGKDAASDMQHRLDKESKKLGAAAERYIQHEPFQSVLIAAGVGAAAAAVLSWWMGSRSR